VDERTDVWSLGCVLHEMLTGEPPFGGDPRSALARSLTERPAPSRGVGDPALRSAVTRALRRDPAERIGSMREFAIALEQKERRRHVVALSVAVTVLAIVAATAVALMSRSAGDGTPEFTQLTNFSDAVTAPALSPDGRSVAFLRDRGPFGNSAAPAQLYIKQLPNGRQCG
jgi:serine/threonine protein kinase